MGLGLVSSGIWGRYEACKGGTDGLVQIIK